MITREGIEKAQQAWGEGIVAMASAHLEEGDYVGIARNHVETLYAYGMSTVLFKPTLAAVEQFRPTFEQALSYFVASNNACPEDKGFAIKGWTKVRFENTDIILDESTALAMGNYFFTSPKGEEVKVEYTFGYVLDDAGALRINLHHSSMPAIADQ
ncbi:MAG: phosphoribosyl-AMP cyclohydrolase [Candidatus Poseidoniales archaeon]|nr:MAG: phosphoribosyl-AMP cyclohydrolase [Candidatus Poseidoniales archaeon]